MKKALIIGNDKYKDSPLYCCQNDASAIEQLLKRNADGSPNFDTKLRTNINACDIDYNIKELFKGEDDIALLYYAGHGSYDENDCAIVGTDGNPLSLFQIMKHANASKHKNKILIFDSCFSGGAADVCGQFVGCNSDIAALVPGMTIMAACRNTETAAESSANHHGVFTSLLLNALEGGAANLLGDVTPGAVYAYIDRSLGPWAQRPVFKTNVHSFCSIRKVVPPIDVQVLRKIAEYFPSVSFEFPLNPSYEFTNSTKHSHNIVEPYAVDENVRIFKELQQLASVGIVMPIGSEHMYFAAMGNKACKLTALGSFYWQLAKEGKI